MGTDKRERQKAGRQARIEAARHAQKKAETRRRVFLAAGLVAFVAAALGLAAYLNNDDGSSTASDASSSSTVPPEAVESAAGKPCVPLSQPLPEGAPDVPITEGPPPTELVIEDLKVGEGEPVPAGATVTVQYIGVSCSSGIIFDSSWSRGGQAATFGLDGVIAGWTEGIQGMQVGGQRLLIIPPDMAYQAQGRPPEIAPDETLYFVVDLEAFTPAAAPVVPDSSVPTDSTPTTATTVAP